MSDIVDTLENIRQACKRPDDSDIPLGEYLLEAKTTITALRAEVEKLKALTVKADEAIARQQQDLEEAADRAADCDILRAENFSLASWQCEFTDGKTGLVGDEHGNQYCAMAKRVEALRAENEKLRAALSGVLWMAEEWFKHGGDETTFADEYEAKLEAARAVITKGEREK